MPDLAASRSPSQARAPATTVGQAAVAATALADRYRLDALIGRGGMADVYRGHDLRLARDVAVKVLREVEHERRFEVEAHTLAALDHPNLVRLLDAGDDGGHLYLVMELLSGASVLEMVAGGPLPPERVRVIGSEAAAGMAHIHERGIVHRDVKPSNLMFDEHGTLRIADFGIVHLVDGATLTGTHQTIGTMAYLAPEQLRGRDITPAVDVYSLGLVLLECLTGERAFGGAPVETAAARLHHDPEVPTSLPAPWPALLRAMTARDPASRPHAHDVHDQLAAPVPLPEPTTAVLPEPAAATAVMPLATIAAAAETVPVDAHAVDQPRARRSRARRLVLAVGALGLTAALAAGVWIAVSDDSGVSPAVSPSTTAATTAPSAPPTTAPAVPATTVPAATTPVVVDDDGDGNGKGRDNGNGRGSGKEQESGEENRGEGGDD